MQSVLIPTYKRLLPRKPCELNGLRWPGLLGGDFDKAWDSDGRAIHLADGSFIEFKSYDQPVDVFAGPPRHIIRHDEEPPEPIYNENQARQATTGVNLLFTMTPLNYSQWLFSNIMERAAKDPQVECWKMPMRENRFVDEEVIKSIEANVSDPAERAARLEGEPTFVEGRVWKEYGDHNLHDTFSIPEDWHKIVIIDPHLEKATAVCAIAESPKGIGYVFYEQETKGDIEQIWNEIRGGLAGKHIDVWLIDPSSRQRTGIHGKGRLIDEFRRFIPYLQEANNDRDLGWEAVRQRVKNDPILGPKFYVMRSCPGVDFQMRYYSWKAPMASGESRGKPEVVKRNDEFPDCVRYWAMYCRNFSTASDNTPDFEIRML
jgi:phage terminase large subunit-like protein